jgi:hypothetical protein
VCRDTTFATISIEHVLGRRPVGQHPLYDESGSISAVLDWELASIGIPEMDVAWYIVLDELFEQLSNKRVSGFRNRESALAEYEARLGRRSNNLHWHKVFALFRAAAVTDRQARTAEALGNDTQGSASRTTRWWQKRNNLCPEIDKCEQVSFIRCPPASPCNRQRPSGVVLDRRSTGQVSLALPLSVITLSDGWADVWDRVTNCGLTMLSGLRK